MLNKAIIAIPLLAAGLTSAHADSTRNFEYSGFDRISAQAGLHVTVKYGKRYHVEIASKNTDHFDKVVIEQKDDQLVVKRKTDWGITGLLSWMDNWTSEVEVIVTSPKLVEATSSSGADLQVGTLSSERMTFDASSGASLYVEGINANVINAEASSGAYLSIVGSCDRISAEASSGADIFGKGLICEDGKVDVSSGADVSLNLTNSLDAEASSGGNIGITGNPEVIKVDQSSGGSVKVSK